MIKSLIDLLRNLQSEEDCRLFLENIRWHGVPVCPHCGSKSEEHYKLTNGGVFRGLYKCKDCRERFTVTVGTMFESSHIPLQKWFIAIYVFLAHKKGISSTQLHKDIAVTQKTAWFMLSRIRYNIRYSADIDFGDITQVDETYIGGKNKNRNAGKRLKNTRGRSLKLKAPVMGLLSDGKSLCRTYSESQQMDIAWCDKFTCAERNNSCYRWLVWLQRFVGKLCA